MKHEHNKNSIMLSRLDVEPEVRGRGKADGVDGIIGA
jgi:hypothetical protein